MNLAFLSSKLSSCYISFNKAETENIKRIGKKLEKREIRGLETCILSVIKEELKYNYNIKEAIT
jgi:hypothetical protein